MTVLAAQAVAPVCIIAGPHGDPEATFTGLFRNQVDLVRRQQNAQKKTSE
ncbi:hypothetical protein ACFRQM_45950 [Streptomyces sp. NPDC056831]